MNGRPIKMANGRIVGKAINGRAVFKVGPKNFFRKAGAYSLDAGAITDASRDCRSIVLMEESGAALTIRMAVFMANAKRVSFGFGVKLVAPHSLYQRGGVEQLSLMSVPSVQPQGPAGLYGSVGA